MLFYNIVRLFVGFMYSKIYLIYENYGMKNWWKRFKVRCKCYSKMFWLGFYMGFEGGKLIFEEEYFKNCLILKL